MPFFDFDIATHTVQLMPPDKRKINNVAIWQSMLSPLQWVRDNFFGTYYEGSTAAKYSTGTYNKGQQVIYDKKVYESLIDVNADLPTTLNWFLVTSNFVGVKERVLYNGNKLIFEYALNKEFGTTFRQPNSPVTPTNSDIYLTNTPSSVVGFVVGATEVFSSSVGTLSSSAFVGGNSPFVYVQNFTINIPASLATSLGVNYAKIISSFADKYAAAGLRYTVTTY